MINTVEHSHVLISFHMLICQSLVVLLSSNVLNIIMEKKIPKGNISIENKQFV